VQAAARFNPDTLQRLADAGLDPGEPVTHGPDGPKTSWLVDPQRHLPRVEGHRAGTVSVRTTVEECCRLGVGQLTLYCLSSENWKRPQRELDFLMALLERYLVEERAEILGQNIRFRTIGRRTGLPDAVLHEIDEIALATLGSITIATMCKIVEARRNGKAH